VPTRFLDYCRDLDLISSRLYHCLWLSLCLCYSRDIQYIGRTSRLKSLKRHPLLLRHWLRQCQWLSEWNWERFEISLS